MSAADQKPASTLWVVIAFATVYLVWGSTYFFISVAVKAIPPMLVGAFRYLAAGLVMLLYCLVRREKVFVWKDIRPSVVSGLLLLFFGNGALIWTEQYISSSLAAILLASGPVWFVLLDRRNWKVNLRSRETIAGLVVGFAGVILLFGENLFHTTSMPGPGVETMAASAHTSAGWQLFVMVIVILASVSWAAGSLYSKYKATGKSNAVNSGWQMLSAGIAFLPASLVSGEWSHFDASAVNFSAWMAVLYLVIMGSLAGYSAFTWLLKVRPATQVSTHAYVNPVVAVLLGVFFGGEKMSALQLSGLGIILISVLLLNMVKYKTSTTPAARPQEDKKGNLARV